MMGIITAVVCFVCYSWHSVGFLFVLHPSNNLEQTFAYIFSLGPDSKYLRNGSQEAYCCFICIYLKRVKEALNRSKNIMSINRI